MNMKPNPVLAARVVALLAAIAEHDDRSPAGRELLEALVAEGVVNHFALREATIDRARTTDDEVALHVPRTFGVHHRALLVDREGRTRWIELRTGG